MSLSFHQIVKKQKRHMTDTASPWAWLVQMPFHAPHSTLGRLPGLGQDPHCPLGGGKCPPPSSDSQGPSDGRELRLLLPSRGHQAYNPVPVGLSWPRCEPSAAFLASVTREFSSILGFRKTYLCLCQVISPKRNCYCHDSDHQHIRLSSWSQSLVMGQAPQQPDLCPFHCVPLMPLMVSSFLITRD